MTVTVCISNDQDLRFEDVEGLTFHAEARYPGVCQWTKYQEEGRGSKELVNVNPAQYRVLEVAIISGELCAFVANVAA